MISEDGGIEVTQEVEVQDLTDVKQERSILPVTKALKVRIAKAGTVSNANPEKGKVADTKGLELELRVVDGIEQEDKESGEITMKFVNKPLFVSRALELCYWADMNAVAESGKNKGKVRTEIPWWSKKQQYVGFKAFCEALGLPLKGLKVNDAFLAELVGKELLVDVQHEAQTAANAEGAYVSTGEFRERLTNWKKAA